MYMFIIKKGYIIKMYNKIIKFICIFLECIKYNLYYNYLEFYCSSHYKGKTLSANFQKIKRRNTKLTKTHTTNIFSFIFIKYLFEKFFTHKLLTLLLI